TDLESRIAWRRRDGSEVQHLDLPHAAAPAVTRDGGLLAFERRGAAGPAIWSYDLKRQTAQPLGIDNAGTPVWSPDGRTIAYSARRDGIIDRLFRRRLAGTN